MTETAKDVELEGLVVLFLEGIMGCVPGRLLDISSTVREYVL